MTGSFSIPKASTQNSTKKQPLHRLTPFSTSWWHTKGRTQPLFLSSGLGFWAKDMKLNRTNNSLSFYSSLLCQSNKRLTKGIDTVALKWLVVSITFIPLHVCLFVPEYKQCNRNEAQSKPFCGWRKLRTNPMMTLPLVVLLTVAKLKNCYFGFFAWRLNYQQFCYSNISRAFWAVWSFISLVYAIPVFALNPAAFHLGFTPVSASFKQLNL